MVKVTSLITLDNDKYREYLEQNICQDVRVSTEQMKLTSWIMRNIPRARQCASVYESFLNHMPIEIDLGGSVKMKRDVLHEYQKRLSSLIIIFIEHILMYGIVILTYYPVDDKDPESLPVPVVMDPAKLMVSRVEPLESEHKYRVINPAATTRYAGLTKRKSERMYNRDGVLQRGVVIEVNAPDMFGNITSPIRNLLARVTFCETVNELTLLATELMCHPPVVTEETIAKNNDSAPVRDMFTSGEVFDMQRERGMLDDAGRMAHAASMVDMSKSLALAASGNQGTVNFNTSPGIFMAGAMLPTNDAWDRVTLDSLSGLTKFPVNPNRYTANYGHLQIAPGRKMVQPPRVTAPAYFIELQREIDAEVVRAMGIPEGYFSNVQSLGTAYNANFQLIFVTACRRMSATISAGMEWFFNTCFRQENLEASAKKVAQERQAKKDQEKTKAKDKETPAEKDRDKALEKEEEMTLAEFKEILEEIHERAKVRVKLAVTIDLSTLLLLWDKGMLEGDAMRSLLSEITGVRKSDLRVPTINESGQVLNGNMLMIDKNEGKDQKQEGRIPDSSPNTMNVQKLDVAGPSINVDKGRNFDTKKSTPDPTKK